MIDGFLPVKNYENETSELIITQLEKINFDFNKLIYDSLNFQVDKFQPKSIVYHKKLGYL